MSYEGMDVDAVRSVATQMTAQAGALSSIIGTIEGLIGQALHEWDGQDAHDFQAWWTGQHRPKLQALHTDLATAAQLLARQAGDQEAVSGGPGGVAPLTPRSMLKFAEASYDGKSQPSGWDPVSNAGLRKLGIAPSDIDGSGDSGLNATVYTDGHGHYVLAFQGSQGEKFGPHQGKDWRGDFQTVGSAALPLDWSHQAQDAANVAVQLQNAVGKGNLELVGHSLGGRDAAVAAIATGAPATTFNAAGPTDEDIMYARELAGRHVSLGEYAFGRLSQGESLRQSVSSVPIVNYETPGDQLGAAQGDGQILPIHLSREALGIQVTVQDAASGHDIHNFDKGTI